MVSRHYPAYRIDDVMKMTPKKAFLMLKSSAKEKRTYIELAMSVLGIKQEKESVDDFKQIDSATSTENQVSSEYFGRKHTRG